LRLLVWYLHGWGIVLVFLVALVETVGINYHLLEIIIAIYMCANVFVVFYEFIFCDLLVLEATAKVVMRFERFQELTEHLILCLFAFPHAKMPLCSVNRLDVPDCYNAITIAVDLHESFDYYLTASTIHISRYGPNKIFNLDLSYLLMINLGEHRLDFLFAQVEFVISQRLSQLIEVYGPILIIIHYAKLPLNANKASGASYRQLPPYLL